MMDVAMSHAWVLSRAVGLKNDQLAFRRSVVQALLTKYGTAPTRPGAQSTSGGKKIPMPARQGEGHLITTTQDRKKVYALQEQNNKEMFKMWATAR